jgi:hypothetical protein
MEQCTIIISCARVRGERDVRRGATYVDSAIANFTSLPFLFLRTEYIREAVQHVSLSRPCASYIVPFKTLGIGATFSKKERATPHVFLHG